MNESKHIKPRIKPVTRNEYRLDRDYWKSRALKQQQVIDTLETHKNQLLNDAATKDAELKHFRVTLQTICPHDKVYTKILGNQPFCDQCKQLLKLPEKRSDTQS